MTFTHNGFLFNDDGTLVTSGGGGSGGSSSGVTSAAKNLKTDYGAKLDARYVFDAVTTSGNGTVTSATAAFVAGDVGKAVAVYDGTTGAQLAVGTVASRGSGTAITLSANATASATGCLLVIGTDDTAALQAAFTAMAAGGGATYVPPGLAMIAGPQQTVTVGSQTYSAQVLVPGRDFNKGMVPIHLFGDLPAGGIVVGEDVSQAPAPVQTGFFSTAMTGACISGQGTTQTDAFAATYGTFARWSEHDLTVERLSFHCAIDGGVHLLRGDTFGCFAARDCRFAPLANAQVIGARGYTRGGTALSMPSQFNQIKSSARRVTIDGFCTGLTHSEHAYLDEVDVGVCNVGIAFQNSPGGYHGPVYGRVIVQSCAVALQNRSTGPCLAAFSGNLYHEGGGANGTIPPICIIDDPNNWLIGQLNVSPGNFGGPPLGRLTAKGGTGMRLTNLRDGTTSTYQTAALTPDGGPATVPGAPVLSASPGDTYADLTWTIASNGNAAITDYVIEQRIGAGSWSTVTDGVSTAQSYRVTGLTNGTGYGFRVSATNIIGTGSPSTEATVTPAGVTTVAADTFNRADSASTLNTASDGGTWTAELGTFGIAGNAAYLATSVAGGFQVATRAVGGVARTHQLTIAAQESTSTVFAIAARVAGTGGSLSCITAGAGGIYTYTGPSTFTKISAQAAVTPVAGDVLVLIDTGSTLTLKINGTTIATATSSFNSSATKAGIGIAQGATTAGRVDNYTVTSP